MPRVTEEQKKFISELFLKQGKNAAETIPLFEAKFGHSPSTRVINKWKYFNEADDDDADKNGGDDADKEKKGGKTGQLDIDTDDTRTVKGDIDISGDEIPDEAFNKLCRTFGHSQNKMWDILVRAKNRGYTKVNASTGEFSK